MSDGCPCTEELSSNVDYDEDCIEQWRRALRITHHSKWPILFLQHPSLLTCRQRSWGRVGWWLEPLYHCIYLFLYFSFSFSLFFAPTPSPSRIPHPKQFNRIFITIWFWLQANSEVSTHTLKLDTLLSKQRVHQSFYQDSPFSLPIAAKTTPKTHWLNIAAHIYYLCHSSLGWLGSASWFLFSTWHQLALPSSGGWHFQDHLLAWMAVGAASLLGAELEWPSSPLCGLSTCLVFL